MKSETAGKINTTPAERETTPNALINALVTLCSGKNLTPEDSHQLALATLVCAHHPILSMFTTKET